MKYDFLPNINKTKILDDIELSLPQQLYLSQQFKPFDPSLNVTIQWEARTGRSFAIAIYYIENLLQGNKWRIIDKDNSGKLLSVYGSRTLQDTVAKLCSKDKTVKLVHDHIKEYFWIERVKTKPQTQQFLD